MDPMSQGRSIPQVESTTSGFKPEELEYGMSDGFPVGHGIPSVVENTSEAMDDDSDASAQSILKYFDSDSSFWRALTPSLVLDLDSPSYSAMDQIPHERSNHSCHTISSDSEPYELEYNMSDDLPITHGAPPVEENTSEAMDENSNSSAQNMLNYVEPDSQFWSAPTPSLVYTSDNMSYVVEQILHKHSISSDSEYDMSDDLPTDLGTLSEGETTLEATDKKSILFPQNISGDFAPSCSFWSAPTPPLLIPIKMDPMSQGRSIPQFKSTTSDIKPEELEYVMSDGLPITHGAPPVEENIPEVMDAMPHESSIISCYKISSDSEESCKFEHDMSDSLPIEDGISPIHTTTKSDCAMQKSLSMMNSMLPKDTKPFHNKKPQTPKDEDITKFNFTMEIVSEILNSWTIEKHFYESKSVYFFSLPEILLSDSTVIHQTFRFKPHSTMPNFHMQQELVCGNQVIGQWFFEKGFVSSKAITIWETFIKRSPGFDFFIDPMINPRLILETKLYHGERLAREYQMHIILT